MHANAYLNRSLYYGNLVNRASPLNRGLVGWWLTLPQRGKGNTFFDIAAANHGTLTNGPTWQGAKGRPGGYGSLALGADDYVITGTVPALLDGWTWCGWINGGAATTYVVFGHGAAWRVQTNGGTLRLTIPGVADYEFSGPLSLATGWNFAAISLTGTAATGYLNGSTGTVTVTAPSGSPTNYMIGDQPFGSFSPPAVDDIAVWSRTMSTAEMAALYNESRYGYPTTLNRVRPYSVLNSAAGGGGATGVGNLLLLGCGA